MIKVYTPDVRLAGCTHRATSVQFVRRFYDVGGFEIHLPNSGEHDKLFAANNIVVIGENAGIIENIERGKELVVTGPCLKGLCRRRVIVPPFIYAQNPSPMESYERFKGNGEKMIKFFVGRNLVQPLDTRRRIENLVIDNPDFLRGKTDMCRQYKFEKLDEAIKEIALEAQLGWDIRLDPHEKRLVFDVFCGADKSMGQLDVCLFSSERGNINFLESETVLANSANAAYVLGSGDEEQQYVELIFSGDGFALRECEFSISGEYEPQEFTDLGRAKLNEHKVKSSITVNANNRLKYRDRWDLGDYVSVAQGAADPLTMQITEVREVYEYGNTKIEPVFELV